MSDILTNHTARVASDSSYPSSLQRQVPAPLLSTRDLRHPSPSIQSRCLPYRRRIAGSYIFQSFSAEGRLSVSGGSCPDLPVKDVHWASVRGSCSLTYFGSFGHLMHTVSAVSGPVKLESGGNNPASLERKEAGFGAISQEIGQPL